MRTVMSQHFYNSAIVTRCQESAKSIQEINLKTSLFVTQRGFDFSQADLQGIYLRTLTAKIPTLRTVTRNEIRENNLLGSSSSQFHYAANENFML